MKINIKEFENFAWSANREKSGKSSSKEVA